MTATVTSQQLSPLDTPLTLRTLLDHAAAKRKLSGRKLAHLAQSHGFEITHTTINGIRNGSYKSQPSNDSIRAIAWLAGVRDETAFQAAGRKAPGRPFADELPPGVDRLGPRERKAAIEMLRALVAQSDLIDELERERDNALSFASPEHVSVLPLCDDRDAHPTTTTTPGTTGGSGQGELDLLDTDSR